MVAELRSLAAARSPGEPLPSSRELGARLGVGPVTVSRAVSRLVAEGVVSTEPGRGTFVARPPREPATGRGDFGWQTVALADRLVDAGGMARHLAATQPGVISLIRGYPDTTLQATRALAEAMARAARRPGAWDQPPVAGIPALRSALATMIGLTPAEVMVVPGGQAGLSAALRALVPPGAPILVESPTYMGLLAMARAAELRVVPVPTDQHGLHPELLAEALALTGARLVYCQPTFTNPTGALMPQSRRAEILQTVRSAGAFLIEDDTARLLAIDAEPAPPMIADDPDGHVVHLLSLTKATAPSLRIGALAARGPAAARLRALRLLDDFFVPQPLQEAAVELLASPAWQRHRTAFRRELAARRDALVAAVAEQLPQVSVTGPPGGGLHLWCRLPDGCDEAELVLQAQARGVLVGGGAEYHAAEPPGPALRLTYASEPVPRLVEGVRRLAAALADTGRAPTATESGRLES